MEKYWRSLEEHRNPEEFRKKEALTELDLKRSLALKEEGSSRRDFLKILGFSAGAMALAASCKKPIDKAIPYLVKPDEVTPGVANYYASTYFDANEYCSILVKVRDGRPIKIEGNSLSSVSKQGTTARVQAALLNLYDDARYKSPQKKGEPVAWTKADEEISDQLQKLKTAGKKVVLLTSTIISPTTRKAIADFQKEFPNAEWIQYDSVSATGILKANELSFGKNIIPDNRFDKTKVVVSFGADFLGGWLNPVEYTKGYTAARKLDSGQKQMLRHYQFETGLSLSGTNADVRFPIKPSETGAILVSLYNKILKAKGLPETNQPPAEIDLEGLANDLIENQGQSMVICGSNNFNHQLIVNAINQLLGNYGNTILFEHPLLTRQGIDSRFETFVSELQAGQVGGLMILGANPVYDHPEGKKLAEAITKLPLAVSLSERPDETTVACHYVCPVPNFLENWGDAEPKAGVYSLAQPCIQKLFDSRALEETLYKWTGKEINLHAFLMDFWRENMFPLQNGFSDFRLFWNDTLQKGIFEPDKKETPPAYSTTGLDGAIASVKPGSSGWEIELYETIALGNGKYSNNPWLQELPDPVAKISWDNFASVPVKWAEENGLQNESVITVNGVELPVFIQPGQTNGTISVALGYGRENAGKMGNGVGKNMFPLAQIKNGAKQFCLSGADIQITTKTYPLALSQTHHSMENRPIIRETVLEEYLSNPEAGNELHEKFEEEHVTLYEEKTFPGYHWAMAIDLNSCTGCGNCTIACQAENNVQVIGKEQVRNRRIMHWIRIDRYFSENPENPKVSFMPVMCQHCDNAPCENVCPVAATPHSDEGLNQMAYNRCVGTRYCINNCPYRVRRFNWFQYVKNADFDFNSNSDLGRMVLNPDVTVRSRGVVEKCSFCVQRIQEKKQEAKLGQRKVYDGEIQTACSQSCPGDAIVFGDLNNPESRISKLFADKRNYHLLEELHTLPSVGYLTKVRNIKI